MDEIDVKTPLTAMKPLHAKWIMNLYDEITFEKWKVVLNSWKIANFRCCGNGVRYTECLDPFNDIDPLDGNSVSFEDDIQLPKEGNPDVNEQ